MKIKRVIRFQEEPVEQKIKQVNSEKQKEDISSNNDILDEECLQEDIEEFERKSSYNAYNELKKYVEKVASGRASSNMIGVFGINSDNVVRALCCNLEEIRKNLIFVGQVDSWASSSDVYNSIAAILLNYIESNYSTRYDMNFYMNNVINILQKVYDRPEPYYDEYASPIESLMNINRKYERDRNLLSAINCIKQIINSSSYSRNNEPKLVINVEIEKVDYKTLSSLAKLNSSDLIIIVSCMFDYNLAKISLRNSVGGFECMDKFFYPDNYVIAGENAS